MKTIIQGLWIGEALSQIEQLSIQSFLANRHPYHLYVYDEVKNIPKGTTIKDANSIIPKKEIFTAHNNSVAGFSDWFRWELLYQKGNFYVDLDVICLKPFNFQDKIVFAKESDNIVAACIIKFPKQHEFTAYMRDKCQNPGQPFHYDTPWTKRAKRLLKPFPINWYKLYAWGEVGGPVGFTNALKHFNLDKLAKPFTVFFPYPPHCAHAAYDNSFKDLDPSFYKNTHGLHLWNEVLRQDPFFDKNAIFPKTSLFEKLKRKYVHT